MADTVSVEKIKAFWHSQVHDPDKWELNKVFDEKLLCYSPVSARDMDAKLMFLDIKLFRADLVISVTKKTKDHWLSIVKTLHDRSSTNQVWKAPPNGWVKINMDTSFSNGAAVSGLILRNWNGSLLLAAAYHHQCLDPLTAECIALLDACLTAHDLKIHKACFESDCLDAISLIMGNSLNTFWRAEPVVDKILKLKKEWPQWSFAFSPRCTNEAAHSLARWASTNGCFGLIPLNSVPINVFCDGGFPLVDSVHV
ncbi:hypothetical protein CASFOL_015470 [Castilleja foliolosa]|uniref:RNase H type-1 domain-containing protein n=1 Tax=Castilleja foliolosa TaxID=1961234 RepID=A0ABD3DHQ4_9LAMI